MTQFDKFNRDNSRSEEEADSTVDMYAMLGFVLIIVALAIYISSR